MTPFYVLDYVDSLSGIVSAVLIAMGIVVVLQAARQLTRQQRLHHTAQLLSPYYDRLVAPVAAFQTISADEFASGSLEIDPRKAEAYDDVLRYLNSLEYVATLVNTNTIDEDFSAKLIRGTVISAFFGHIEYVVRVRAAAQNPRLYQELEALAHRWGGAA